MVFDKYIAISQWAVSNPAITFFQRLFIPLVKCILLDILIAVLIITCKSLLSKQQFISTLAKIQRYKIINRIHKRGRNYEKRAINKLHREVVN